MSSTPLRARALLTTPFALGGLWLVSCGASSEGGDDPRQRGLETCEAGRCDESTERDDDAGTNGATVPCPREDVVARRDSSQLALRQTTQPMTSAVGTSMPAPGAPPSTATSPVPAPTVTPEPLGTVAIPPAPVAGNPVAVESCGDGIVSGEETCDDLDSFSGDGCDALCRTEPGFVCSTPGSACSYVEICGDGVIGGLESCDDGNTVATDGCSTDCSLESGYSCLPGRRCTPVCGDGVRLFVEPCDDGNTSDGDGCNGACRLEPGYVCTDDVVVAASVPSAEPPLMVPTAPAVPLAELGSRCFPSVCGDGLLEGGEACDDGNAVAGDGCDPRCVLEPSCSSSGECLPVCGDGFVDGADECDDGNLFDGDGCSSACTVEAGFVCELASDLAQPLPGPLQGVGACASVCGDGIAVGAERCDDGAANGSGYGTCGSTCRWGEFCGDGIVQAGVESCDNGVNGDPYQFAEGSCGPACVTPGFCGDGITQGAFEQCDLGQAANVGDYGGCTTACTPGPRCGDGLTDGDDGEQCDDGNRTSGDGCSDACIREDVVPPPGITPAPPGVVTPPPPVPPAPLPTNDVFVPPPNPPTEDDGTEPAVGAPCP